MTRKAGPLLTPYLRDNYMPIPGCGCWLWLGAWSTYGYGKVNKHGKVVTEAHRMFYEDRFGPIPDGMQVLHKCDTPPCCNPDHLFLGTQADNMRDMHRKGRWHRNNESQTKRMEPHETA